MQDVFDAIERTPGRDFLLRLSMMEIYNEVSQQGGAATAARLLAGQVMLLATGSTWLGCYGSCAGQPCLLLAVWPNFPARCHRKSCSPSEDQQDYQQAHMAAACYCLHSLQAKCPWMCCRCQNFHLTSLLDLSLLDLALAPV